MVSNSAVIQEFSNWGPGQNKGMFERQDAFYCHNRF